jgi:protein TonB
MEMIFAMLLALAAAGAPPQAAGSLSLPITEMDYPIEALKLGQEGETSVELLIDKRGRVRECSVTASSGSPWLDAGTCAVMMDKGRFTYAAGTKPGKLVITQRLAWKLPH